MTWLSTWPSDGCPQYREHATEQAAEEHALAMGGVAFWSEGASRADETIGDAA